MPPGTPWRAEGGGPGAGGPPYVEEGRKGPRWIFVALAAVLVVGVAGGAWAAVNALRGGGTQPADALPGNAVAYVRVDLDPSAAQKIAALRFLRKFPEAKDRLGSSDDLRKALFEAAQSEDDELKDVNYAKDIEPWLGDRMGVAALPPGEGGNDSGAVAAIQITDEEKARAGIEKLRKSSGEEAGVAFVDDYAIVAETQAQADRLVEQLDEGSLADNDVFQGDMDALGDDGVFSFWADMKKVTQSAGAESGMNLGSLGPQNAGRIVGTLRFDDRYVELVGQSRGVDAPQITGSGIRMGELPGSTAAALSVAGAGDALAKGWPQLIKMAEQAGMGAQIQSFLDMAQQQYGLALPGDLVTLLGKELTVALDEEGLDAMMTGGEQLPAAGLRSTTDVAKAEEVVTKLEKVLADSGAPIQLGKASDDESMVVATTQSYADLMLGGGDLGDDEGFTLAVPDADQAQFGMFVDIDKLEKLYLPELAPDEKANAEVLQAIGMSGSTTDEGGNFTMRLVVN